MELTEHAMLTNEFDKGYQFGKQEMLYFLINSSKYIEFKDGDFIITLDTLKSLQKEETDKNGIIKQ